MLSSSIRVNSFIQSDPLHKNCAVVLGASGALGSSVARILAEHGYRVIGTGHHRKPVCQYSFQFDITQTEEVLRFQSWLHKQALRIGVVFHGIGLSKDQLVMRMTDAEWAQNLDVNLKSAYRVDRKSVV